MFGEALLSTLQVCVHKTKDGGLSGAFSQGISLSPKDFVQRLDHLPLNMRVKLSIREFEAGHIGIWIMVGNKARRQMTHQTGHKLMDACG